MSEKINVFLTEYSRLFMFKQVAVIFAVFLIGFFLLRLIKMRKLNTMELLMCFPFGMSLFVAVGFFDLVFGIPFRNYVIVAEVLLITAVAVVTCFLRAKSLDVSEKDKSADLRILGRSLFRVLEPVNKKGLLIILAVIFLSFISTLGVFSVSVSNDSLYYYSMFPRALVNYGKYRREFNVFLMDVGQGSAIIGTLPYLFGFDENFGIQTFFQINVYFIFVYGLFDYSSNRMKRKTAFAVTFFGSIFLLTSMPYILMSKWAMSNGYFCGFMFLIAIYVYYRKDALDTGDYIFLALAFLTLSLLRMEGFVIALFLLLIFSAFGISNKTFVLTFLLPEIVASVSYDFKVFFLMDINAPYTFLTKEKALLQLAAYVVILVYVIFVRGKYMMFIQNRIEITTVILLCAVNVCCFLIDRELFVTNIKAFAANLLHSSGWSIFPMAVIAIYIFCFATIGVKEFKIGYFDVLLAGYVLLTLAVCFAREGAMQESFGDSGNRVLMQCTLIASYASISHLIDCVSRKENI